MDTGVSAHHICHTKKIQDNEDLLSLFIAVGHMLWNCMTFGMGFWIFCVVFCLNGHFIALVNWSTHSQIHQLTRTYTGLHRYDKMIAIFKRPTDAATTITSWRLHHSSWLAMCSLLCVGDLHYSIRYQQLSPFDASFDYRHVICFRSIFFNFIVLLLCIWFGFPQNPLWSVPIMFVMCCWHCHKGYRWMCASNWMIRYFKIILFYHIRCTEHDLYTNYFRNDLRHNKKFIEQLKSWTDVQDFLCVCVSFRLTHSFIHSFTQSWCVCVCEYAHDRARDLNYQIN